MASYTFKWEHPEANEVFVTGTFDDWGKTEKLHRKGDFFEKDVQLPNKDKILYKFVVDGNWTVNSHLPQETDEHNNVNNVLHPHQLGEPSKSSIFSSSAAPLATTAGLAGAVPLASEKAAERSVLPGSFPETPLGEPPAFSVAPIPATEGAGNPIHLEPGEKVPDPSSLTKNTISNTVGSDEPFAFGVAPIPATEGAGNPIHLEPGEKVPDPSTFTKNTIQSTVASDEPAAFSVAPIPATPGAGNPIHLKPGEKVPDPSTFTSNTINSAVTEDKSLASDVPEVVTESQEAAKASPEASANPEAVEDKKDLEEELKAKVPEEPPTSESGLPTGQIYGALAGGVAAIGAAAAGAAAVAHKHATTAATEASKSLPSTGLMNSFGTGPNVPDVVKDSIAKANVSPEATTSTEALKEKDAVESELLKTVKPSEDIPRSLQSTGAVPDVVQESIAKARVSPEAAASAEAVREKDAVETELQKTVKPSGIGSNGAVPDVVKDSIAAAHVSPEATTSAEAVEEKDAVESELLKKVKPATESGEPAPTATASTSAKAPEASGSVFGVAPLPATAGAGNPVHLAPGEKVPDPSSITANTLTSNVHTDKEAYEKADALPIVATAAAASETPKESTGAFSVPPVSKNMIPESSLPMDSAAVGETDPGVTMQSAAPTSTTAMLAGKVPLESKPESSTAASGLSSTALSSSEPLKSSSEPDALNAPASAPAVSEITKENIKPEAVSPVEPVKNGGPTVTSGTSTTPVAAKTTEDGPATPKKEAEPRLSTATAGTGTPGSDAATPDSKSAKKSKRRSIFNKCLSDISASAEEAPINAEAVHFEIRAMPAGLDGGIMIGAADGAREALPHARYSKPDSKKADMAGCCVIV
ncbi:Phosphatidylserine decarboxylase proenzyme 1 [Venturia nashicola]|uniref:Phosphatidylserine decarboxylase proenzyme 1 n=1 Tax=Venturia nashicola TaxID=86259 RepID=A0A4Z1PUR7_9PEZI|nr:Phosphatidylserine decarboxylase proenzyme 1 [Venturia nashicola]